MSKPHTSFGLCWSLLTVGLLGCSTTQREAIVTPSLPGGQSQDPAMAALGDEAGESSDELWEIDMGEVPLDEVRGHFWLRRAAAAERHGQIDRALYAYAQARELLRSPVPCIQAAELLVAADRVAEVGEWTRCVRRRAPSLAIPDLLDGVARQVSGDTRGAESLYESFAQRAPRHRNAREARFVAKNLAATAEHAPSASEPHAAP